MVLDKVVVKDWRVDVHYNIPLPKPAPPQQQKVSSKFDLRSTCIVLCEALRYVKLSSPHFGIPFSHFFPDF